MKFFFNWSLEPDPNGENWDQDPDPIMNLEDFQASLELLLRPGFEPSPKGNLCTSGALYFWGRGRTFLHKNQMDRLLGIYKKKFKPRN